MHRAGKRLEILANLGSDVEQVGPGAAQMEELRITSSRSWAAYVQKGAWCIGPFRLDHERHSSFGAAKLERLTCVLERDRVYVLAVAISFEQPSPEVCSQPAYDLICTVGMAPGCHVPRAIKDIRGEVGFGIMT